MPQPNTFTPMMPEMQLPFTNFPEPQKNMESFPNIYGINGIKNIQVCF